MPTYVLSKVKRTGAGQKVGDIVDQDHPPSALTALSHDDDIIVLDKSAGNVFKRISRANLTGHLNGLIAAAWSRITGKPSTFPPSSHTHPSSDISGLGTAASRNVGSTSGRIPLLGPSGDLEDGRIPSLSASKTNRGQFSTARIPNLTLSKISDSGSAASRDVGTAAGNVPVLDADGNLDISSVQGLGTAAARNVGTGAGNLPELDASGDLADARIPSLNANKINRGQFSTARIPNLTLSKISDSGSAASRDVGSSSGRVPLLGPGGEIEVSNIPDLPASRIALGVFRPERLALSPQVGHTLFATTTGTYWAAPAGTVFDIHDDVTQAATIADSDRMAFSDEGTSGDPMRYTSAANLANYMETEVRLNAGRVVSGIFVVARIPNLTLAKISDSGSAASRDVGTGNGNVPVLNALGDLADARIPSLGTGQDLH